MFEKLFGRKERGHKPSFGGLPVVGTPTEGGLNVKIEELRLLVISSAERRGYPEPARALIADRIEWLERRGMPGLFAWILELTEYGDETIEERSSSTRPDGSTGRMCPFVWSAHLDHDKLVEITSADPERPSVLAAPSHPVLVLPKLTRFLGAMGRMITVHWAVDGHEILQSVMDGYRVIHRGDRERTFEAYLRSTQIGISRFPEEREPVPPLAPAHLWEVFVPTAIIGRLANYMEATS